MDKAESAASAKTNATDGERKCKPCGIAFSDLNAYVEHLESKDHVKGIMKKKYGAKYLEAKANLNGESTKEDLENTGFDNTTGSDEDDDVYTCNECEKICTGLKNYRLHLAGNKHAKRVKNIKMMEKFKKDKLIPEKDDLIPDIKSKTDDVSLMDLVLPKTKLASSDIICEPCKMSFSGPVPFKQHISSRSHKDNVEWRDYAKGLKDKGVCESNSDDETGSKVFARCDVCQKGFSGPMNYHQHMKSIVHLRQVRHAKLMNNLSDDIVFCNENGKLQCKVCGKCFSGPIPFKDHLKSSEHEKLKKNSNIMEDLEKHPDMYKATLTTGISCDTDDSEPEIMLICKTCKTAFSGPVSAREHFTSPKHKKAVKMSKKYKKVKNQMKQTHISTEKKPDIGAKSKSDQQDDNAYSSDEGSYDII